MRRSTREGAPFRTHRFPILANDDDGICEGKAMTAIRITGGSCGAGAGTYLDGLFTMPDSSLRGVETLTELHGPEAAGRPAPWSGDIVRGLRGALASAGTLPRALSLAVYAMDAGLGVVAPRPRPATLRARFCDGTEAVIETDDGLAAVVARDRALVQAALSRGAPPAAMPDRTGAGEEAADRATTAMFEYEKRNGRIRRIARNDPTGA